LPGPANPLPFATNAVDPATFFPGTLLLTVPHQDDGVLACGATIARLPDRSAVHVVYATDGGRSPEPVLPWGDRASPDLPRIRADEAREAMGSLGVPADNVHFLELPDGGLRNHAERLRSGLRELVARIVPAHVLAPFRYDRHTDHLALNRTVTALHAAGELRGATFTEYFVYHYWRLLPRGDVRAYIRSGLLQRVDPGDSSGAKRDALDRFRSQTTRFYPWQTRPNLTPQLLDAVSEEPEVFLRYDPALPGARVFAGSVTWIRLSHRFEPVLKKRKDQAVALLKRGFVRRGGAAA
jgi:LmbE family N-acetylglucosaminyl deacetylase